MKRVIAVMGVMLAACGMPSMPDYVPVSERYTPTVKDDAAGAEVAKPSASKPGAAGGSTPSNVVSGSSASGGNPGTSSAATPDKLPLPVKVSAMPVVLNEILYDLPGDDTNGDLFVELRGTPGGDLGGYKISFINGDDGKETENVVIPAGLQVPDDGLFVIADGITGDLQHTHVANADYLDNFDPQNGPDSMQLIAPDGKLADAVSYGTPKLSVAANGLGMLEGLAASDAPALQSISRLVDADDTDNNSDDFVVNTTPSPGTDDVTEAE
jgi:hypothetical protein